MNLTRRLQSVKLNVLVFLLLVVYILFLVFINFQWDIRSYFRFNYEKEKKIFEVYIIGKAAIAQYLWQHLLSGYISYSKNGFYQIGNKSFSNLNFIYLSGPGYIQTSIPKEIEYMVLVLNGRSLDKVNKAKEWLDFLYFLNALKKVAVVLLGNEQCKNGWITKYMKSNGGVIDVLFVVYDTKLVDDKDIFQWPLGVATYRGFPDVEVRNVKHIDKRRYKCNFIGTIYKNSSRQILNSTLRNMKLKKFCYLFGRDQWVPEESHSSLQHYVDVVENSDLTLSPVGVNSECYRIYEAMSLGSVPVVEDYMTPGNCASPLRMLKQYNAPLIYVKDWSGLSDLINNDLNLNFTFILQRRKNILKWYHEFKISIALQFVKILKNKFFNL